MKLQREGTKAKITGAVGGPQGFMIAGSRIAFNILSSGLYNNKIGACIRELCCNAWDAHVMAGKRDTAFEVHLPTSFEPWFSVKDNGIGLNPAAPFVFAKESNEKTGTTMEVRIGKYRDGAKLEDGHYIRPVDELIDLYCTYFSSNKNDSNDVIGAMGLGSKSPFCYTEGFTVISRFGGETRVATAIITEQGTPDIIIQSVEQTPDAPNGLEVSFPVKESDCWEFENNGKVYLEFFDPKPVLTGAQVTVNAQNYVMKTDRWGMRDKPETHQGSGIRAVQGLVAYNVGKIDISKMGPELQALMEMPLDLFFPIGELAVAASRESLQLDPRTVQNIIEALKAVYTGMVQEVKKEIDAARSLWEARLLIWRLINTPGTGSIISEAWDKGDFLGQYKNFNLADQKAVLNEMDYKHTQVYRFKWNKRSAKYATKSSVFTRYTPETRALALQEIATGTKKHSDFECDFDVEGNVAFVINDIKFGGEKYIHFWLQEAVDNEHLNSEEQGDKPVAKEMVYLFSRANVKQTPAQVVAEATKMVAELGNPAVVLMSELRERYSKFCDIKNPTPKKAGIPRERRDVIELNTKAEGRKTSTWSSSRHDLAWCNVWKRSENQPTGVKYYVVVEDNKAIDSGYAKCQKFVDFVKNVQNAKVFGLDKDTPVYGLKPKSPLRLETKEWIELTKHVFNSIAKVMSRTKELQMALLLKPFRNCDWEDELLKVAGDDIVDDDSPFKMFAVQLALAKKHSERPENKALDSVLDEAKLRKNPATDKPWYDDHNVANFKNGWEEVQKLYPMLQLTSRSWYGGNNRMTILRDYIKMVDMLAAKNAVAGDVADAVAATV